MNVVALVSEVCTLSYRLFSYAAQDERPRSEGEGGESSREEKEQKRGEGHKTVKHG